MRTHGYLRMVAAVVLMVLIIGLCGCVGLGKPGTTDAIKPGTTDAIKDENVVVINGMPVIQPDPAVVMDWYDTQVAFNLYSPLVYPAPEGGVRPHLAQSWEAVDGKPDHWRFTLRQGVKFHDGSELTSQDVVFSMDRFIAMGQGFSGMLGKVKSVAVSKYVVDFILDKPNSVFPQISSVFFPLNKGLVLKNIQAGKYGEFGDYGANWLMTHDAGTGPYVMVSNITGESMEASRFEGYFLGWANWGPNETPIEKLKFIMETEPSTLKMLLTSGQLDLEANGSFSRQMFQEIQATKSLHLNQVFPQIWTVWMNTKVAPTDDVHFRQAIMYAFDYKTILGEYAAFGAQAAGIYPSQEPGSIAIPPQPRQQDLKKAKEELALSKYKPGDVTVVFHYCGGLAAEQEIGLELQADLSKLGIKVEIVGPTWSQYEAECATPQTTPNLTIFMFPLNYPSPDSFLYFMYHPDHVGGIYGAHWNKDAELGKLIDQSRETVDPKKVLVLYKQIQERIASQALAVYPYQIPGLWTSQDYLIGPKEKFTVVGPEINMSNWRINLVQKKQEGR